MVGGSTLDSVTDSMRQSTSCTLRKEHDDGLSAMSYVSQIFAASRYIRYCLLLTPLPTTISIPSADTCLTKGKQWQQNCMARELGPLLLPPVLG